MKVSVILPVFKRASLLDLGLKSLSMQKIYYPFEILVINDGIEDETEAVCDKYPELNIRYIFSGQRNKDEIVFRTPAFAFNIGIKQSTGDIVMLSNPEIFHLTDTMHELLAPLDVSDSFITSPANIMFDNTGKTLKYLREHFTLDLPAHISDDLEKNNARCKYASRLPFCIALEKKHLIEIGGYDEDYSGWACDDDDIIDRLILKGLSFFYVNSSIIHLYHAKQYERGNRKHPKFLHNYNIYMKKKGTIIRNEGKDWGKL